MGSGLWGLSYGCYANTASVGFLGVINDMKNLAEFVPFVNKQVAVHQGKAKKLVSKEPSISKIHAQLASQFDELRQAIEAAVLQPATPIESQSDVNLDDLLSSATAITPRAISGLPPALIEQLQVSESDRINWTILEIIERTPEKMIALDILLIALYKVTGQIFDRTELGSRLYRLGRKDEVFSVPGRKGVYTTIKQSGALFPEDETNTTTK
jgi:hypothetical protein